MSNKLNCTADTCVNNINNLCSANTIHVEGNIANTSSETECETFSEKGFRNAVTNLANMNFGGEIKQLLNSDSIVMSPKIKCEAINCQHNSARICNADNVTINGPGAATSSATLCETFED